MTTAREKTAAIARMLPGMAFEDVNALRRIQMTLHRWGELECGDGSGWAVERDEKTGQPFMFRYSDKVPMHMHRYATPDRERGALKRLAAIMARYPQYAAYHQTDPRGCALYIIRPGDVPEGADVGAYYNRGVAVCA